MIEYDNFPDMKFDEDNYLGKYLDKCCRTVNAKCQGTCYLAFTFLPELQLKKLLQNPVNDQQLPKKLPELFAVSSNKSLS